MEQIIQNQCPKCHAEISTSDNFCKNCGISLKIRPQNISIGKQIFVYAISFFLAPLGLIYVFKYLRQPDKKAKMVGIVSLGLTIIAIIATIFIAMEYLKQQYSSALDIMNL